MSKITLKTPESARRCERGIIMEYMDYVEGQESPSDFHLWTIIGVIGMAMGRNVWVDRFYLKLYPNLYIILVGESALTHKSTALKMGLKPLQEALPDIATITQKVTPARLSSLLSDVYGKKKVSEMLIHASELSVLIGQSKLDDSLLKLLTDYWDCPDEADTSTVARGTEPVKDVFLVLLGGTTADWLRNSIPLDTLEGGFLSRIILVNRSPTGIRTPFPEDAQSTNKIEKRLNIIHDLKHIRNTLAGQYEWDADAKRMYANWYTTHNEEELQKASSFMRGYYGRKGDMIIKLAMISAASKSDAKIITREDIYFGIQMLNENETFVEDIIRKLGTTEEGRKYTDVLQKIRTSTVTITHRNKPKLVGGIEHSRLMRTFGHKYNAKELADIVYSLTQAEEIISSYEGRTKIYIVPPEKGGTELEKENGEEVPTDKQEHSGQQLNAQ